MILDTFWRSSVCQHQYERCSEQFISIDNVYSEQRPEDVEITESGELSALVASMNTVCPTNPVLVGQYQRLSLNQY